MQLILLLRVQVRFELLYKVVALLAPDLVKAEVHLCNVRRLHHEPDQAKPVAVLHLLLGGVDRRKTLVLVDARAVAELLQEVAVVECECCEAADLLS
jgi:hypothetical protein